MMPVAVETSKRKFHQLLDSLTAASAPSSTKAASHPLASNAKRVRASPFTRMHPDVTASAAVGTAPISTPPSTPTPAPHYEPWSQPAFLARLQTFADVARWTPGKPDTVDGPAWARRGWTCVDVDTVACRGGCERRVVVVLRPARRDAAGLPLAGTEDWAADVGTYVRWGTTACPAVVRRQS